MSQKFYKKLKGVSILSVNSHIQIHYILAVTKEKENSDSFKGKNLPGFCLFLLQLKYNEFEDKISYVCVILLEICVQFFLESSVIFTNLCAQSVHGKFMCIGYVPV